ncbi:hypothetical protein L1077_05695 [Pseudoalteromonas luteoviolacea]|uniref:hypothetical protein n=1 Tax=Pseudoalteromonas luteoviolacea TaxID=43657 RepID=UPI001F3B9D48|nr:hypothetical protein [Pseudoalteromonas luteoviolacea]MCF6438914.1 hypothetical protein [Pseudoalteromonas luteoviolacea]
MVEYLEGTVFTDLLVLLGDYFTLFSVLAVVIFYLLNDKLALRYSVLCAVFYIVGNYTHNPVKAFDDDEVYRYIIWALNDIVFIAIVAYWAIKDKMYMWQSVLVQLVVLPAPLLQLFRLVDRHLMDLSYSTYLYKTILPFVNFSAVALCFAPLILYVGRGIQKYTDESRGKKEGI